MTLTVDTLLELAMANPINAQITARLPDLGVQQCMLTAGCLFQAVWNHQANLPADQGVKDYDVFYFDEDVSYEAEDAVIRRAQALFQDLGVNVEVKNQARVHLWYGQRFGRPYPQLHSARARCMRLMAWRMWSRVSCASTICIRSPGCFCTRPGVIRRVGRGSRLSSRA